MTSIERFSPLTIQKSWGDETLIAHVPPGGKGRDGQCFGGYTGKVLRRYADPAYHRAGLQFHRSKDETFYLLEGEVIVYFLDASGVLRSYEMHPGESFHVPPGAVHSVETLTDSIMIEASNPVFEDRVMVEAKYDITKAVPWP